METKSVTFTQKAKDENQRTITVNNTRIERKDIVKYLEVLLERQLTYHNSIKPKIDNLTCQSLCGISFALGSTNVEFCIKIKP